jgi:hypothetical protein
MIEAYVEGVGLCGPGLPGWVSSRAILAGVRPYVVMPVVVPPLALLPANERRRMVGTVKLSMAVGSEAIFHAGRDATTTPTVFTSSSGDGDTIHQILESLAAPEREVSPTRFHNSVHNAPAGYWSIATRSHEPTTALCGYDASFAAGLLEAAAQMQSENRSIAIIAYDLPYPEPLKTVRPIVSQFGTAMVLSPQVTDHSLARLTIGLRRAEGEPTLMPDPELEKLRRGNPAARSLPLLAALARHARAMVAVEYRSGKHLTVDMTPIDSQSRAALSA